MVFIEVLCHLSARNHSTKKSLLYRDKKYSVFALSAWKKLSRILQTFFVFNNHSRLQNKINRSLIIHTTGQTKWSIHVHHSVVPASKIFFAAGRKFVVAKKYAVVHDTIGSGTLIASTVVSDVTGWWSEVMKHPEGVANFMSQNCSTPVSVPVPFVYGGLVPLILNK